MTYADQSLIVPEAQAGDRLDVFLAAQQPEISRSQWKNFIIEGVVQVNGQCVKPNHRVHAGESVRWKLPKKAPTEPQPEKIPLEVLFEDEDILVLNKSPGLVVHPAAGNETGTLLNALLFHDPVFRTLERAGIVHRLDKDTSGVMVVGKTPTAMESLQSQFKARKTKKEYCVLVWGHPQPPKGRIKTLISRHAVNRKKMAVCTENGREAISYYQTLETFSTTSLLSVRIETGRTHQIRVHLAHLGWPVVGDIVYGRARKQKLPVPVERQMLHAAKLSFTHPRTGEMLSFEAPLFDDMQQLLECLRKAGRSE